MRRILKNNPPRELTRFVEIEKPVKFEEIHHSTNFPNLYHDCLTQLKEEQHNLSGYTEKPLVTANVHIDHFKKQALFNDREHVFGWENMIVDEHAEYGADHKDKTLKQRSDYTKLINPVTEDPHHFLTYMDAGIVRPQEAISPDDIQKANYTIETFNLNHPLLVEKKRIAIMYVRKYKEYGLTDAEIKDCMKDYGFPSVVEYALNF